jgi:hypothetical protein
MRIAQVLCSFFSRTVVQVFGPRAVSHARHLLSFYHIRRGCRGLFEICASLRIILCNPAQNVLDASISPESGFVVLGKSITISSAMNDSFHIERYRRSDREQVFDLFRAAYPPDLAAREIKQWDWKHDANPFNAEAERYRIANRPHIWPFVRAAAMASDLEALVLGGEAAGDLARAYCILLWNGDRLAGSMCPVPQRFMISGAAHWVVLASNFIVHPDFRGQHLSVRISLTICADNPLNLNFGNPPNQPAMQSWRRTNRAMKSNVQQGAAKTVGSMRLTPLLKPIDWYAVAGTISSSAALRGSAAIVGRTLDVARRQVMERRPAQRLKIAEVDSFDDHVDELWSCVHRDYGVIAIRDLRYLKWRYHARPDITYRYVVAIEDDTLAGYLVFRMGDRDGMQCGYIVDFLVRDHSRGVFAALLSFADEAIVRDGAKAIICALAPPEYRSMLWRAGYFPARMASTPLLNAMLFSSLPALRPFMDPSKWYVTMGDGNLEHSH